MPTPVNTAKQCLNTEASQALEEAVRVAHRRGHAQTTSLHAIFAFLSLSPSPLKQACIRAKNIAFYPKKQLKALDLCLSVSLDRLPISKTCVNEPKISNSLMAAIKRSQANQRRHPDSFITVKSSHDDHGQCEQDQEFGCSSSGVKVELQHLIVSILDDPIVSRVFNDAGFCSFDVKVALFRPFQGYFGYSNSVFGVGPGPGSPRLRLPFLEFGDEEGEYRRIGEVLVRKKGRNPLLVGVGANDVLKGFVEILERRKENGFLPLEILGINVLCIEKDLSKFVNENWSYEAVNSRFKEFDSMIQQCLRPGLIISFGNLMCFLGKYNGFMMDLVNFVVQKLTKLLEIHSSRVWFIGSAGSDQMYMEFLHRFPSIDKEWDLQPLPMTSVRPSLAESCFKSSLMGSFVPLGGFFLSPDVKASFSSSYQYVTQCNISSGKLDEDNTRVSSRGCFASVADDQRTAIPPWLQMPECEANNMLNCVKAKGSQVLLSSPTTIMQSKGGNLCHCWDHAQTRTDVGSYNLSDNIKNANNENSCTTSGSCKDNGYGRIKACTSMLASKSSKPVLLSPAKVLKGSPYSFCISGVDDGQTSPSSVSIATDLGLELFSQASEQRQKADAKFSNNSEALFKALFGRIGRQCQALRIISQTITQSWMSNGNREKSGHRADIWLNFTGPDIFCKRKIALALADILFGSKKNFIHIDLCRDMSICKKSVFGNPIVNGYEARSRGKTIVDQVAEELRKMPSCVVLFENAHSADPLLQRSLLQAIKDGKLSDSYGREVATNNRIFVLNLKFQEDISALFSKEKPTNFPEERLSRAKGWPLQIFVKGVDDGSSYRSGKNLLSEVFFNKRKLFETDEITELYLSVGHVKRPHRGSNKSLDLNLPAETGEDDDGDISSWYLSERSNPFLEGLSGQLNKNLVKTVFDSFDYDALASKILKSIHASFNQAIESKCLLEIEPRVIDQIIAVACLSDNEREVEDWINNVLGKGFTEVQRKYQPSALSTVMIATLEALYVENHVQEVCLPSKIILT